MHCSRSMSLFSFIYCWRFVWGLWKSYIDQQFSQYAFLFTHFANDANLAHHLPYFEHFSSFSGLVLLQYTNILFPLIQLNHFKIEKDCVIRSDQHLLHIIFRLKASSCTSSLCLKLVSETIYMSTEGEREDIDNRKCSWESKLFCGLMPQSARNRTRECVQKR